MASDITGIVVVTKSTTLSVDIRECYHKPVMITLASHEALERYLSRFPRQIDILYLDIDTAEHPVKLLPFIDAVWWQNHTVKIFLVSESLEKLTKTKVDQKHFVVLPIIEQPQ